MGFSFLPRKSISNQDCHYRAEETVATVLFKITTDILGPFNAPFAISQVGYVPGVLLYFFMGLIAFYTGILLWTQFTKLDSDKYPIRSYGDLAHRLFGTWARHSVSLLESLQLIVNVGSSFSCRPHQKFQGA